MCAGALLEDAATALTAVVLVDALNDVRVDVVVVGKEVDVVFDVVVVVHATLLRMLSHIMHAFIRYTALS